MGHHLQGSGTVGRHNGTASAGGQSDGGQPAPGCDRYAPNDVIDRTRNMPAIAAGTASDPQSSQPSRTGAAPSTLNNATPARPHPLIRYNRPESRGGTESTGAFS